MISTRSFKIVEIDITTYKKSRRYEYISKTMNEDCTSNRRCCRNNQNKFICSICLNKKSSQDLSRHIDCCRRNSKSCPICQKNHETGNKSDDNKITKHNNTRKHNEDFNHQISSADEKKDQNGKNIQTSQPDVTQGLTLLNEVLTVFQTKKQSDINKNKTPTLIFKDASVSTEDVRKYIPKLTASKVFQYSIDEDTKIHDMNKFIVLNCQPESKNVSQLSLNLTKHKSSSIPQMKLDELKNSLKEKTKSKDAIEEVNRMFATVRKHELNESLEDSNRPITRNGPRVLPVVKTNCNIENGVNKRQVAEICRCCQTNYHMSSGDSLKKHECCHRQDEKCECFYMMCCHYQNHCANSGMVCENCRINLKDCRNYNGGPGEDNTC